MWGMQPGVASVYCSIVQQAQQTSTFYLRRFEKLEGLSFGQARRAFDGVVICGYMRREHGKMRTLLNPCDRDILEEGDQIISLAHNGMGAIPNTSDITSPPPPTPTPTPTLLRCELLCVFQTCKCTTLLLVPLAATFDILEGCDSAEGTKDAREGGQDLKIDWVFTPVLAGPRYGCHPALESLEEVVDSDCLLFLIAHQAQGLR